jgi:ketosteroid isomerase-like protein
LEERFMKLMIATCLLGLAAAGALESQESHESDSAAVAAVVRGFHDALEQGDSARALSLLGTGVRILEAGNVETRAQYAAHHLANDMAAARALESDHTIQQLSVSGDAAWAVSKYTSRGHFGGRQVDSEGAELTVLRRTETSWEIQAIHWSSRRRSSQ